MEKSFNDIRKEKIEKSLVMQAAGKSLEEAAAALNVSWRTIYRWWKTPRGGVKTSRN